MTRETARYRSVYYDVLNSQDLDVFEFQDQEDFENVSENY